MSETLRITRAAGVKMLLQPKLLLPAVAAAAVGYVAGLAGQATSQALVQKWVSGGGIASGSALVQTSGFSALSRGQVLVFEIIARVGFEVIGSLCLVLALVATVRMMRRNGEVTGGVPWKSALGLGVLWWLLGAAVDAIVIVASMQLDGIVSGDAVRTTTMVSGVVFSAAILWVLAPRAVRLAATQGGALHPESEKTGQRTGALTAVLSALLLAISNVVTQFSLARLSVGKTQMVAFAMVLVGALPLVAMFIGFGMLTARDAE